jgi:Tannase and feruloyl esterase
VVLSRCSIRNKEEAMHSTALSRGPGAIARIALAVAVLALPAIAMGQPATRALATCDDSLKNAFKPDALTTVTLVKAFKKGADLNLDGKPTGRVAPADVCVVKLNVGPGNRGPANAQSTSPGIGMEIWLPSPDGWHQRIHILGGGGFAGDPVVSSPTALSMGFPWETLADIAGVEGAISGVTDTGHGSREPGTLAAMGDGSFAMNPDGSINTRLWEDFSARAIHELAVKTKELALAFYGQSQAHAYFEGCSTGGRQALKEVQDYPADFDGVLGGDAAINWTRFITSEMYPQIVMQRDLEGKLLSAAQLNSVSAAAVSACDRDLNGEHSGYITDPAVCRYDPTRDPKVLCKTDGGENATPACVTRKQARAIDKMWFGQTVKGEVPDPAVANGYSSPLLPNQLWYGVTRGTQLAGGYYLAESKDGEPLPFVLAAHQLAIQLRNAGIATASFENATGNGHSGWTGLSYADLARAQKVGVALKKEFAGINTDDADLTEFRKRHGKLVYYHGLADQLIVPQGSNDYFTRVGQKMGGRDATKDTYRYFQIPGMGHCMGSGSVNGVSGVSPPADPPLPAPQQFYDALVGWVEKGAAPDHLVIENKSGAARPVCAFPARLKYSAGDRKLASSYTCK